MENLIGFGRTNVGILFNFSLQIFHVKVKVKYEF